MGIGTELNSIEVQLGILEREIKQETLRLIAEGKALAVEDPASQAFFRKHHRWTNRLQIISKRLKTMEHGLLLAAGEVRSMPRDQRFRARQSVDDRDKRLQKIKDCANRAAARLAFVYQKAVTPTDVDVVNNAFQLLQDQLEVRQDYKKVLTQFENSALRQTRATAVTAISKARQQLQVPQAGAPDALLVLSLVLQLLRIWWLEKLRQDRQA